MILTLSQTSGARVTLWEHSNSENITLWACIEAGVPQRLTLGPVLFSIYINLSVNLKKNNIIHRYMLPFFL